MTPQAAADVIVARMVRGELREALQSYLQQHGAAATLQLLADVVDGPSADPLTVRVERLERSLAALQSQGAAS